MKKALKSFWDSTKEAWRGDWIAIGLLTVNALLWLIYLPFVTWIFGMLFILAMGTMLYSKGVVKGMDITRSIYEGTYEGNTDEPEVPPAPRRREWTEDEL